MVRNGSRLAGYSTYRAAEGAFVWEMYALSLTVIICQLPVLFAQFESIKKANQLATHFSFEKDSQVTPFN